MAILLADRTDMTTLATYPLGTTDISPIPVTTDLFLNRDIGTHTPVRRACAPYGGLRLRFRLRFLLSNRYVVCDHDRIDIVPNVEILRPLVFAEESQDVVEDQWPGDVAMNEMENPLIEQREAWRMFRREVCPNRDVDRPGTKE